MLGVTKSGEEIQIEIAKLKDLQPHIIPTSVFGDDNKDHIQAEIDTLEQGLDEEHIYQLYGEQGNDDKLDLAMNAYKWSKGLSEDCPSECWSSIDTRTFQ